MDGIHHSHAIDIVELKERPAQSLRSCQAFPLPGICSPSTEEEHQGQDPGKGVEEKVPPPQVCVLTKSNARLGLGYSTRCLSHLLPACTVAAGVGKEWPPQILRLLVSVERVPGPGGTSAPRLCERAGLGQAGLLGR